MEVVGSNGKEVLWKVVDDHVVEEENDDEEIALRGFDFFLTKTRRGLVDKG